MDISEAKSDNQPVKTIESEISEEKTKKLEEKPKKSEEKPKKANEKTQKAEGKLEKKSGRTNPTRVPKRTNNKKPVEEEILENPRRSTRLSTRRKKPETKKNFRETKKK